MQHEHPQQMISINRTLWRANTLMPSYFAEGDWQVRASCDGCLIPSPSAGLLMPFSGM